jgi:tetratricopeptide (TPR) repeat protein
VSGFVLQAKTKEPIRDAEVTVEGNLGKRDDVTDSKGTFSIPLADVVTKGDLIRIRVEKMGYETYDEQLSVSELPIKILLQSQTGSKERATKAELHPLPRGRLSVGIARFRPVSSAAQEEAENVASRIQEKLLDKQHAGAPIEVLEISRIVLGADESARERNAVSLGLSRQINVHILIWGDVRRDENELYITPHLTIVQQFGPAPLESATLCSFRDVGPMHLQLKELLSTQIADVVNLLLGVAYYRLGQWDRAMKVFDYVQSKPGLLFRGLVVARRSEHQLFAFQDLTAAIAIFSSLINSSPPSLGLDDATKSAYINRANAVARRARWMENEQAISENRQAITDFRKLLDMQATAVCKSCFSVAMSSRRARS